jgi:hypothetical protein
MTEAPIGHHQFVDLCRPERRLIELQRFGSVLDGQIRRYGVVSGPDGFCTHRYLLFPIGCWIRLLILF